MRSDSLQRRQQLARLAAGLCLLLLTFQSCLAGDLDRKRLRRGFEQVSWEWQRGNYSGELTALYADPARFQLELLTAAGEGGRRRPIEWGTEFELLAVINASMYQANGRSTALLIDDGVVNNGLDHPSYGGFLAFAPRRPGLAPVRIEGRDCASFDLSKLRADYASIVQNYRFLDCSAQAVEWRDARPYAACAVALDADGHIVFIHSGAALPMREFAQLLKEPKLRLRSALFTEGGAQAALVWRRGDHWLSAPSPSRSDATPQRSLPNVLGLRVRAD